MVQDHHDKRTNMHLQPEVKVTLTQPDIAEKPKIIKIICVLVDLYLSLDAIIIPKTIQGGSIIFLHLVSTFFEVQGLYFVS